MPMNPPRCRFLAFALLTLAAVAATAPLRGAPPLSAEEQRLVRYVDDHRDEFVTGLEQAVRIDSATENVEGVKRMGAWFRREFDALGFGTRWIDMPATMKRGGHLFAERTGTKGRRLLLIGHLDTVLRGGEFRRDGAKAFGSGVNDMKGGDLIVLQALKALHAAGALADTRIIVAFTGDEESVGQPRELARRDLLEAAQRSDLALAFETAIGDTVTVARRGTSSWTLEVSGATGHSAGIFSASAGSGAVFEAARILNGFYEKLRAEDGLTISPALIVGGTEAGVEGTKGTASGKSNVIAGQVVVRGDLRFLSPESLARAKDLMKEIAARNLPRTSAKLTFRDGYPAMAPRPENYALLAKLDEISQALGAGKVQPYDPKERGAGDISFVAPLLPGLDGLGVRGEGAHAPTEEVDLASAPDLVKRTAILLYRLTR